MMLGESSDRNRTTGVFDRNSCAMTIQGSGETPNSTPTLANSILLGNLGDTVPASSITPNSRRYPTRGDAFGLPVTDSRPDPARFLDRLRGTIK
jgi:hypothetical protein